MSAVLLRTLTRKSKLGFGKYSDLTVDTLLKKKIKGYLIWVYYNASAITFTKEILDELDIWEEKRIPKPGKNPELTNEYKLTAATYGRATLRNFKNKAHHEKEVKANAKARRIGRERIWHSKAGNAWKNQGH